MLRQAATIILEKDPHEIMTKAIELGFRMDCSPQQGKGGAANTAGPAGAGPGKGGAANTAGPGQSLSGGQAGTGPGPAGLAPAAANGRRELERLDSGYAERIFCLEKRRKIAEAERTTAEMELQAAQACRQARLLEEAGQGPPVPHGQDFTPEKGPRPPTRMPISITKSPNAEMTALQSYFVTGRGVADSSPTRQVAENELLIVRRKAWESRFESQSERFYSTIAQHELTMAAQDKLFRSGLAEASTRLEGNPVIQHAVESCKKVAAESAVAQQAATEAKALQMALELAKSQQNTIAEELRATVARLELERMVPGAIGSGPMGRPESPVEAQESDSSASGAEEALAFAHAAAFYT